MHHICAGLIFGLPANHWCYIQDVNPGYTAFCYAEISKRAAPLLSAWHTEAQGCKTSCLCRMPMFLYNYSTRQLHGIWESTTKGEWMLNPAGKPCRQHLSYQCLPCPLTHCAPAQVVMASMQNTWACGFVPRGTCCIVQCAVKYTRSHGVHLRMALYHCSLDREP